MSVVFVLIAVIVALLVFLLLRRRRRPDGMYGYILRRKARKQAKLDAILQILEERGTLTNAQIRRQLRVSERTIVRYMDELEKAGQVEQVGKTGRYTHYRRKVED